ncbi:uncharacterized protein J3R85_018736 [Psidium guajava]|nr:uncharacterized protein J3R85_018736 [Psidium guajava]
MDFSIQPCHLALSVTTSGPLQLHLPIPFFFFFASFLVIIYPQPPNSV